MRGFEERPQKELERKFQTVVGLVPDPEGITEGVEKSDFPSRREEAGNVFAGTPLIQQWAGQGISYQRKDFG